MMYTERNRTTYRPIIAAKGHKIASLGRMFMNKLFKRIVSFFESLFGHFFTSADDGFVNASQSAIPSKNGKPRFIPIPIQNAIPRLDSGIIRGKVVGKHKVVVPDLQGKLTPFKVLGQIRRGGTTRIRRFGRCDSPVVHCRFEPMF